MYTQILGIFQFASQPFAVLYIIYKYIKYTYSIHLYKSAWHGKTPNRQWSETWQDVLSHTKVYIIVYDPVDNLLRSVLETARDDVYMWELRACEYRYYNPDIE